MGEVLHADEVLNRQAMQAHFALARHVDRACHFHEWLCSGWLAYRASFERGQLALCRLVDASVPEMSNCRNVERSLMRL